jgi:hypothetical protein
MTAAEYRNKASEWLEMAADLRRCGKFHEAATAEFWSRVWTDAAHMLALNPDVVIDIDALAAARADRPVSSTSSPCSFVVTS